MEIVLRLFFFLLGIEKIVFVFFYFVLGFLFFDRVILFVVAAEKIIVVAQIAEAIL